jgi:hypothetical protein
MLEHAKTSVVRGQRSVSLSELGLGLAQSDPSLAHAFSAVTGAPSTSPPARFSPVSYVYTVQGGDTLRSIALRLGLDWSYDLYLPHQAVIESAAKAHGESISEQRNLIYPRTCVTIQADSESRERTATTQHEQTRHKVR